MTYQTSPPTLPELECSEWLDLAAISGYYAQLTGVLAGFAFTAMVLLLTPSQVGQMIRRKTWERRVLRALFAAFFALVIATLTYSVLAGDTAAEARNRAATAALVDGIPFGISAIMLLQGIAILLEAGRIDHVTVWTARAVSVAVAPTLTLFYITIVVSIIEAVRSTTIAGSCQAPRPHLLGILLSALLSLLLSACLIPAMQRPFIRILRRLQDGVPIVVIAVTVAAAIVSGGVSIGPPDLLPSRTVIIWFVVAAFALLLGLGLAVSAAYIDEHDRDNGPSIDD